MVLSFSDANLTTRVSAVRYICLVAVLLALPLTAGAQQRRAADRGPGQNRSEQRQSTERQSGERRSNDRRSDDRQSDGRRSDARGSAHPPANASTLPWWERRQTPWWEQKQTPWWEQRQTTRTPTFELNRIPGYAQGNVAGALLDQQRYGRQGNNPRRSRHYQPTAIYVLPAYPYFQGSIASTTATDVTPAAPAVTVHGGVEPPLPPMGALRLEVEPKESLQIYVDGVYLGTPADLGDEIELAPGTRRIELRARGYRSLTFSAEILDGRSISYRGSLDAIAEPATPAAPAAPVKAAPAAPVGSRTMYMIPGCYLGNVSPKNVTLPAGCDISKLTTISP
jgi:hypothetical protein